MGFADSSPKSIAVYVPMMDRSGEGGIKRVFITEISNALVALAVHNPGMVTLASASSFQFLFLCAWKTFPAIYV